MEMLVFIVAWFVIGLGIAFLIGAAASVADASRVKPVIRPAQFAWAPLDATEVIERRRTRRKPAACYPTQLLEAKPARVYSVAAGQ